jgi:hypothetical protein
MSLIIDTLSLYLKVCEIGSDFDLNMIPSPNYDTLSPWLSYRC